MSSKIQTFIQHHRETSQTKSSNRINLNPFPRAKVSKEGMMRRGTKAQITKWGNVIGSRLIEGKFAEDRQVRSRKRIHGIRYRARA